MKCETCGNEFFEDWRKDKKGSPRFCSKTCSQVRHWSEEQKQTLREKMRVHPDLFCIKCGKLLSRSSSNKKGENTGLCSRCEKDQRRGTGKYGIEGKNWGPYIKAVRKSRKKEYILLAGGSCAKCGYDKYYGALDFHHKDPKEKDFNVTGNGFGRSDELIKKEIQKCILLCCRCHRELHEELRQGKTLEQFLDLGFDSPWDY